MSEQARSVVSMIKALLKAHPEIAHEIELYAATIQGKSPADFYNFREWKRSQNLSNQQIFEKIYEKGHWGRNASIDEKYFSGTGSHNPDIIDPYVNAVSKFLSDHPGNHTALDIGCGDFNVGSRLSHLFAEYTAVDIVPQVIEQNIVKYVETGVRFSVMDITDESPQYSDVIFLRQVLQHLSNVDIQNILDNLQNKCKYLILTEHYPSVGFVPNINKMTGVGTRIRHHSGVVISENPFSFDFQRYHVICEVPELGGIIRTIVYTL